MARKKSNATSKSTSPPRTRNGKLAKPKPNLSKLTKLAATKTKQFLHSENTTGKYDGYVKRGKEFLASFVEDEGNAEARRKASHGQGLSVDGEEEIEGDQSMW
jgi:hypothetical protein